MIRTGREWRYKKKEKKYGGNRMKTKDQKEENSTNNQWSDTV